jgi:tetratricopeptide (TPR) repeat protein
MGGESVRSHSERGRQGSQGVQRKSGGDDIRVDFRAKAREYLREAIRCYEKASELADDVCCLYLVDLARAYAFDKKFDEAEREFARAEQIMKFRAGDVDSDIVSHLYNQWGLARTKRAIGTEPDDTLVSDVIKMYRKSMASNMDTNQKQKDPLENLREVVKRQSEDNPRLNSLQLENEILAESLDHYSGKLF